MTEDTGHEQAPVGGLQARSIVQSFGGALALDQVDFEVQAGEIHALLGENGAGKSTLVKVLTGALSPDSGEIIIDGQPSSLRSPRHAQELGIGVVYQDFHLFPMRTVAENIFSASSRLPATAGFTSRRRMNAQAAELLGSFGVDVDPRRIVGSLDAAERKLVEICRALLRKPRYLILDEPTAALEPRETIRLLNVIRRLKELGTGVILVTHRLGEVVEIADRATALRNGLNAGTMERSDFSLESLARLIVGQEVVVEKGPTNQPGPVRLRVCAGSLRPDSKPVEVSVGAGEIVGVIGLIGSGVSTLLDLAAGVRTSKSSRVEVDGVEHVFTSRRDAQRLGIGAVPIDRKATGLVLETSVAKNIGLSSLGSFSSGGFTRLGKLREAARESQQVFDIRLSSVDQPVKSLSGGNQQKVMLGRWHVGGSSILIIQEPTQGVDIGARQEIHRYLINFAESGGSVLFSSSDLEEVRTIAHRIYVMHAGEVVDEISTMGDVKPTRQALTQAMAAGNLGDAEREVWV